MKFNKRVLENGVRLITVPMVDTETVTVLILVEAGSKYETKETSGLSHFLEHMCFKGTDKRPSANILSTELDSIGAEYNAFTSHEYTGYYAKAHKKHLNKIVDIVSDLYLHQRFDDKEIEREKGVIIEEINMYEDLPQRKVEEVLMSAMYGDQPAGWSIAGNKDTVSAFKKADFIKYLGEHYVSEATVVVVSGAVGDENLVVDQINSAFKNARNSKKKNKLKTIDSQSAPVVSLLKKTSDQTHLILSARSYDAYNPKNYALNVMSGVLGKGMSSRLFQLLREKMGVCYYVRSGIDLYTDHGSFQISAGVDTKRVEEVVSELIKELKRLKEEKISDIELAKAKDFLTGHLYLNLESSDSFAEHYGSLEVMKKPLITPDEIANKINAVTALEIQAIANEIFISNNLTLAMVSPFENSEAIKKILAI